jgi:cytochrome c oxidase assembly protein subunit 11
MSYTLVCSALGIGQNPQNASLPPVETVAAEQVDGQRVIRVYFEGRAQDGLPVEFSPEQAVQDVVIGSDVHNVYHFKNRSDETVRFRPIHNVTPSFAATSYSMKVCFCFNDQEIEPGGEETFEVVYRFNPDLDERITFAKVRYDLFAIAKEDMRPVSSTPEVQPQ